MILFNGTVGFGAQLAASEQRAGALQLAMERLSAAVVEGGSKDDAPADGTAVHERLLQLQSALTAGELDRRALQVGAAPLGGVGGRDSTRASPTLRPPSQEGLEVARRALAEAREEKGALREQLRALREERAALQRGQEELEAQGRQQQEVRAGGGPQTRCPWPAGSTLGHPPWHPLPPLCRTLLPPCSLLHPAAHPAPFTLHVQPPARFPTPL